MSTVFVPASPLSGTVTLPPSKSHLHRLVLAAALLGDGVKVHADGLCEDVLATVRAVRALGCEVTRGDGVLFVGKRKNVTGGAIDCGESASTFRFTLPVCAALGGEWEFLLGDSLSRRPHAPLFGELIRHGAKISQSGNAVTLSGKADAGEYAVPAGITSQFESGLRFASLVNGCTVKVTGDAVSRPYAEMTARVIDEFKNNRPREVFPEGDASAAANFAVAGALSERGVTCTGFCKTQADGVIADALAEMGANVRIDGDALTVSRGTLRAIEFDVTECPDAAAPLAALMAAADGESRLTGTDRLRAKESDRVASITDMITSLGGYARDAGNGIIITGTHLSGGTVTTGDHRIAMAAASIAAATNSGVTVTDASCVAKSYPEFWETVESLR